MGYLLETIDDIIDNEGSILPKKDKEIKNNLDEELFNQITDFIMNLEPESLKYNQLVEIINILNEIEDNINESVNPKLANRSTQGKNQYGKKWYKKNKNRIKKNKEKFKRSAEGKKEKEMKDKKNYKTPTGRTKSLYHVRKKSDRHDEYKEREYGK